MAAARSYTPLSPGALVLGLIHLAKLRDSHHATTFRKPIPCRSKPDTGRHREALRIIQIETRDDQRLLRTHLNEPDRRFVRCRLGEERASLAALMKRRDGARSLLVEDMSLRRSAHLEGRAT
jgi:hypothetical protein